MKNKIIILSVFVCAFCMIGFSAKAEAKSHFSLNIGALFNPPVYERYVVEHYEPAYYVPAPVYVRPEPVYGYVPPRVYVAPRPMYREVHMVPRHPVYRSAGASISWHHFN